MRQRFMFRLALLAAASAFAALGMVPAASAATCSGDYCTLDLSSTIYIQNNVWGSSSSPSGWWENITTNSSTAWRTDFYWPTGSNDNSVKAYPAAMLGWHWGWHFSQAATGLPRQLSSSYTATSNYSYSVTFGSGGVGNVAYDLWITNESNPGSSTQPTDEVMIWVNSTGGAGPCGSVTVSNVSLNGATWNLSQCQIPGYQYVWSFVRTSNSSSGSINFKTFLDYLRNSRGLSSSKYLAGIEFGTEIFHGTGNLNVTNYTASVSGGGSTPTPTPTPTATPTPTPGSQIIANGTYRVIARHSGKALDVYGHGTADGSNVIQWAYGGGNNQRWTLTHLGNNVYRIIGVESGKALEVASTSTANGTNVDIRTYSGANNQRWTISATSGGYYRLTPVSSSGSALDVNGRSTADGANVFQWSWTGGTNQQWTFQAP